MISKYAVIFLLLQIVSFSGCVSDGARSVSGAKSINQYDSFLAGDIRVDCFLLCGGTWGMNSAKIASSYNLGSWKELATDVMNIGYRNDISYYLLGAAAEGLGKPKAAQIYYKLALDDPFKCVTPNCLGLDVPTLAKSRYLALNAIPASNNISKNIIDVDKIPSQTTQDKSQPSEIANPVNSHYKNESKEVILIKSGGVYEVPVILNDVLKIRVIMDSGAADVSIAPDVALTLIRTGTIQKNDWLPGEIYRFADGSTALSPRFKIRSIVLGDKELNGITASISSSLTAPMLLAGC